MDQGYNRLRGELRSLKQLEGLEARPTCRPAGETSIRDPEFPAARVGQPPLVLRSENIFRHLEVLLRQRCLASKSSCV
jgi:hypothetical protein